MQLSVNEDDDSIILNYSLLTCLLTYGYFLTRINQKQVDYFG